MFNLFKNSPVMVLNRDDGMHLPHEFLNLALRDRT